MKQMNNMGAIKDHIKTLISNKQLQRITRIAAAMHQHWKLGGNVLEVNPDTSQHRFVICFLF